MNLRFEGQYIPCWANRYDLAADKTVAQETAPRIKEQGYLTAVDLTALCHWKSPRIRSYCAANDPDYVKVVTAAALTTPHERLRIKALTLLSGVCWPRPPLSCIGATPILPNPRLSRPLVTWH